MLTSIFPWLSLIADQRTDDDGVMRTWTTIGYGDVTKRVKVVEGARWGRWSYTEWRTRQDYLARGGLWWEPA